MTLKIARAADNRRVYIIIKNDKPVFISYNFQAALDRISIN